MADTLEREDTTSLDTGAPVPVAVEYVEAQLSELWRDVAEAAQAKGGGLTQSPQPMCSTS